MRRCGPALHQGSNHRRRGPTNAHLNGVCVCAVCMLVCGARRSLQACAGDPSGVLCGPFFSACGRAVPARYAISSRVGAARGFGLRRLPLRCVHIVPCPSKDARRTYTLQSALVRPPPFDSPLASRLSPLWSSQLYCYLGMVLHANNKHEEALQMLHRASGLDPVNPQVSHPSHCQAPAPCAPPRPCCTSSFSGARVLLPRDPGEVPARQGPHESR